MVLGVSLLFFLAIPTVCTTPRSRQTRPEHAGAYSSVSVEGAGVLSRSARNIGLHSSAPFARSRNRFGAALPPQPGSVLGQYRRAGRASSEPSRVERYERYSHLHRVKVSW